MKTNNVISNVRHSIYCSEIFCSIANYSIRIVNDSMKINVVLILIEFIEIISRIDLPQKLSFENDLKHYEWISAWHEDVKWILTQIGFGNAVPRHFIQKTLEIVIWENSFAGQKI